MLGMRFTLPLALVLACKLAWAADNGETDWPQFMGPQRDATCEGVKLAAQWPKEGPRQVWKVPCATGYSGPVVADGILVLMERNGIKGAEEITRGLDAESGRELWRSSIPCDWPAKRGYTVGPSSTPAIAKGKVVCLGIQGKLRCLELKTGKLAWEKDLLKDYQAPTEGNQGWGFVTSPLIVEDLVILQVCAGQAGLVAWRIADGAEAWRTESFGSYGCSPGYMLFGQTPVVLALATGRSKALGNGDLAGLNARDGKVLWWASTGKSYYNVPSPIPGDGMVFIEGGGGDGPTVAVKLPAAGTGEAQVAWKDPEHIVRFSNYLCYRDLLFGQGNFAHGGHDWFYCLDAKEGKLLWEQKIKEKQQWLLGSDGKILHLHENGELALFDANAREGYRELARAKVIDGGWAHPALCKGKFFARSDTQLVCLDLAAH